MTARRFVATHALSLGALALALSHCGAEPAGPDASSHDASPRTDASSRDVAPADDTVSADDTVTVDDAVTADDTVTADDDVVTPDDAPAAMDVPAATDASAPADAATPCTGSNIWTCNADRSARTRCVGGVLQTDACPHNGCTPEPTGTDDVCSTSCSGSASGTTSIWSCTSNHWERQRCVSGVTQTEMCSVGCVAQPSGTDDFCADVPAAPGSANCHMMQWWNRPYSWNPGTYAISWGGYSHDNDLAVSASTPVQLRHASRLVEQSVHPWGWMPQFVDTVTGEHFAFLHLRPQSRFTTNTGHTYPAGTLVGYSGGDTTDTGYMVSNGSGSVYSTGAHLCVVTQNPFHTAFPMGTDPCH